VAWATGGMSEEAVVARICRRKARGNPGVRGFQMHAAVENAAARARCSMGAVGYRQPGRQCAALWRACVMRSAGGQRGTAVGKVGARPEVRKSC